MMNNPFSSHHLKEMGFQKEKIYEETAKILDDEAARRKELDGPNHRSLISPELFKDMLIIKKDLCKKCSESEIENLVVYCNREHNIEESTVSQLLNSLIEMLVETNKFSDRDISERTGLDLK